MNPVLVPRRPVGYNAASRDQEIIAGHRRPSGEHAVQHWYAIHCKPREDARAELHLENQGFEIFRPKQHVRRRRGGRMVALVDSLFPRYLFIRLDNVHENWAPIRSTRGVVGLVRWGNQVPTVPEPVVETLRARTGEDGCVAPAAVDCYRPGERLRIEEGPFAGLEGIFQARRGEDRVILLLELMRRAQRLLLPETAVARA